MVCKVLMYERVFFKFIEFNLGRIELMHIGTDSIRRGGLMGEGADGGGNDQEIAFLWTVEYCLF